MVERARLLGSEGKGLGQQTGGNASTDVQEVLRLLPMIGDVDRLDDDILSYKDKKFVKDLRVSSCFPASFTVTGKQLFWLRDIKDKLVEQGLI